MAFNFSLAVEEGVEERLAEVEITYAGVELYWKVAADAAVRRENLGARLRRHALGRVGARRAELREEGLLLGTRTALVSLWIRRVLAQAGEIDEWPEVPDGVASLPGRRVGVSPRFSPRFAEKKLNIGVSPVLFETVRRAAYWLSAPAEEALQQWSDRHGPGPAAGGLALLAAALRGFPSAAEMQARDEARNKIVTTGMILRAAVWQAIGDGVPEDITLQKLQDNAARGGNEAGTRIAAEVARSAASKAAAGRKTSS
ncbi:hypothetical protein [Actinoplanes sp. NPDC051851]|uniref:hypothetical protein n=1 Tax=Actinoplanes sp. NPDC051851 TaxID=3154753 RepID=UPI003440C23B